MFIKGEFTKGSNTYDAFNGSVFVKLDRDSKKLIFKDIAEAEICSMAFDTEAALIGQFNNICGIG